MQKHPTLYDINLDIHEGEKIVIVGPSGSGKSTLGNCLNGLCPLSYDGEVAGTLTIQGKLSATSPIPDRSRVIGTVLQDTDAQFVGLNAAEDIAFSLENDNTPLATMRKEVARVAEQVGLSNHLHHTPQQLSGGQKQRAALGGVLVDDVDILLFDEPLANLDPRTGMHAIEIIDTLCREAGKTVIIIEHRLEDVLHCAVDRIVLIDGGRIIADQPPHTLLRSRLLIEHGLREPLPISLFRYAGLDLSLAATSASLASARLASSSTAPRLTPTEQQQLKRWFAETSPISAPTISSQPAVELRHATFSYDGKRTVLHDVSFAISANEIVAIVGKNGAGKTTACKLICGFETLTEGEVWIGGRNAADDSIQERASKVGYVMQNPNQMITEQIVNKEVSLGLRLRGIDQEEIDRRVKDTLGICGLTPYHTYPISALSYGQKKRLTIASILILNPQLIILDEPTAGQDYRHYSEIMEFLRDLHRNLGLTILLITHDMHLMLEYAQRALVLSDGNLLADLPTAEVLTNTELSKQADLKETSLYHIAEQIEIDPRQLVEHFVAEERRYQPPPQTPPTPTPTPPTRSS